MKILIPIFLIITTLSCISQKLSITSRIVRADSVVDGYYQSKDLYTKYYVLIDTSYNLEIGKTYLIRQLNGDSIYYREIDNKEAEKQLDLIQSNVKKTSLLSKELR